MVAIVFLLTHGTQLCQNCAKPIAKPARIADSQAIVLILKENLARPRRFERPTFAFGAQFLKLPVFTRNSHNVAADFAVLCANCHRMIHRTDDPSNLSLFRGNLAATKT